MNYYFLFIILQLPWNSCNASVFYFHCIYSDECDHDDYDVRIVTVPQYFDSYGLNVICVYAYYPYYQVERCFDVLASVEVLAIIECCKQLVNCMP